MDTEGQILNEAYALFHQFGIKSVTMDDIARKLSMSKKTLYKYHANKKSLVLKIMETQIRQTENECIEMCSKADNAIHELLLVMEMVKRIFHNINPSLMYDLQKHHPRSWKLMEIHQNEFLYDMIMTTLSRGVKEKLFRESLNIKILTKMRLEEMKASYNAEIFPPSDYNMEELQVVMLEHFILGISTLEGHEIALKYQKEMKNG